MAGLVPGIRFEEVESRVVTVYASALGVRFCIPFRRYLFMLIRLFTESTINV